MERLDGFVAGALLQRLRRVDGDETAPICTSFRGAALFADISGYSTLAEGLCAQGRDGVERLGKMLDVAFRDHVRCVDETGGEIACFAGDALIAYWPADDGNVPRALRRAHDCARLLHEASRLNTGPTPSADVPAPVLHVGVSAGDMWAARLGADERWHLLLAGPAVRQACAAGTRAAAGETVIAPAAGPFVAPLPEECPAVAGSAAAGAAWTAPAHDVGPHVPRRVQEYASEGYSAWIPQRRTICCLFVRIDGLDETAHDALARHQTVLTSLDVALRPYTGSGGTLLLDDKGLVFALCLGMPHDTHADDALRAVRAGLAICGELSRLGIHCAGGVASGRGVCMPVGAPRRRQYWAVGRFNHVAARLMEAAGTGLLCMEEVGDRVRRAVSLSPERPLSVKGVRWPLRVFRVRDAAALDDHPDVIYGREDEQAALDAHLDRLQQGRGAIVWMVGDAGLGKTALVHYLREAAARRGIQCLCGGAGSVEIAVPYGAWRRVFAAMVQDDLPSVFASQDERRGRLGAVRHPQLAPLINAVVPGFLDETPATRSLSGQARADATSTVLSEVIGAHATDRFLLVLEDCHWMDSASCRLLPRVAQDYPEALIVLTSRPGGDVKDLEELVGPRRVDRFVEMRLSPLRPSAIGSLVESLLGGSVSPELIDQVTQHAGGNPLFAREYALLLNTRLSDPHLGAPAAPRELSGTGASDALANLIASRLDALSATEELVLKAASVIGDAFSRELVARVYPGERPPEWFDTVLASLVERQLVVRAESDPRHFHFQHALIREVTYGQLTRDQGRELHRRVAEALEREYQSDLRAHFGALAHHWSRAESPEATLRYADQAAAQALAGGAFEETERLLASCIELAADGRHGVTISDRIRWHRQLADARHGMGKLESRSAAAHQALALAGVPRPHTRVGLLAKAGGRLCALSVRHVLRRVSPGAGASQMLDLARAYRHSAEVCYFNNDMVGMICDSFNAVACASTLGPSAVLAGASTELGGILSIAGLRRIGERILNHAIALAEAADDQAAQAHAHMVSCLYHVGVGDWKSAEKSVRRCQELSEPMDDRVNWTNAQAVRFWMSHYRSHDTAAYDAARNLHDRALETGNRQHQAWAFRFLALCALRNGSPAEAIGHLQGGLVCLGETAVLNERMPTLGLLALAQLQHGEVWAARATAMGLADLVRVRRPIGHSTLEGYSALLTVALDAWRDERAPGWKRAIRKWLRVLERYQRSFPVGVPRYYLHRGDYLRISGAVRAARRSYRRGEAAASRLGMPWDATRCREALSELNGPS